MVNRLVSVDEDNNLPVEVHNHLVSGLETEFSDLADQAASSAQISVDSASTASTAASNAEVFSAAAQQAATEASAPTDEMVALVFNTPGSAARAAADTRYAALPNQNTFLQRVQAPKIDINGGNFTEPYDADLWIAGRQRLDPANLTQGMYLQHRMKGNMGAQVHCGMASELRIEAATNATYLNAIEAGAAITGGGVNDINDIRAITANVTWRTLTATGTIKSVSIIRAQEMKAPPTGLVIERAYSIFAEPQSLGTIENWNVYAPVTRSYFGGIQTAGDIAIGENSNSARTLRITSPDSQPSTVQFESNGVSRWQIVKTDAETGGNAGSDLVFRARTDTGGNHAEVLRFIRQNGSVRFGVQPLGFYGTTPVAKPTVTGSRGGNAALTSLLAALSSTGLINNNTTA